MLIMVIYENKRIGLVNALKLSELILAGDVIAFRRLDGWVRVGNDPVRGFGGGYSGPERRMYQKEKEVDDHFPQSINCTLEDAALSRASTGGVDRG